jgi:hypothetical protein
MDGTHFIEQEERIEVVEAVAGERAVNDETGTLARRDGRNDRFDDATGR